VERLEAAAAVACLDLMFMRATKRSKTKEDYHARCSRHVSVTCLRTPLLPALTDAITRACGTSCTAPEASSLWLLSALVRMLFIVDVCVYVSV